MTLLVAVNLGVRHLDEIHIEHVGEADEVDQHVGHLVADPLDLHGSRGRRLGDLSVGAPLHLRGQLADLTRECQREVHWGTELFPVPHYSGRTQSLGKTRDVTHR